jgi:tubulin--tyrosine ligase
MLAPYFTLKETQSFSVLELRKKSDEINKVPRVAVHNSVNCPYSRGIVSSCISRRPWCISVKSGYLDLSEEGSDLADLPTLQIGDFENIRWDLIMGNGQWHGASSYLVRKGLSRKAQLALQIRRFTAKRPHSVLHQAIPFTLIVETWGAFDEMSVDTFGKGAVFDVSDLSIRDRLDICLYEARLAVAEDERTSWRWILKPSVTNKGSNIVLCNNWKDIIDALEDMVEQREWVLQRYVENPLLVLGGGHKFHLRVYVLCVDALKVYVFNQMLVLIAAHNYDADDTDDIYRHLTNTARAVEDMRFDEAKFVKLIDDLPEITNEKMQGKKQVEKIKAEIYAITSELFSAFEAEYTVFAPMDNCFEIFGLDFMLSDDGTVHLLEVNPGPDFKQTGGRLKRVIESLFEDTFRIVVDKDEGENFTCVYDKVASTSGLGGMTLS